MTAVHVISHTHWDREWYLTFEQYRGRLVELVDRVLDRMAVEPRFTHFHLDGQAIVLEDYVEVRPEREHELRARIAEGRVLAGPWYVMPDMFLVSGEALVRNLAMGLRVANAFGGAMRVGYMPDPFGHVGQMPQILAGCGLEGAILWRGFGGPGAEYVWEAPDGSRALLLHLPVEGYCNGLTLPLLPAGQRRSEAAAVLARERARSTSGQLLLMVGVDHVEPHPALIEVVDAIDAPPDVAARLSTLPAYVRAVQTAIEAGGHALDVVRGELRGGEAYAHLLPGVLSARTYLKQSNARVQREIELWAEPASVFAQLCGAPVPPGALRYAWRTLLQNHPHDSICGCSIDEVHEENVARFARARQAAEGITSGALKRLGARVPPAPPGAVRCLLVNTHGADFSGVIEGTVEIALEPMPGERPLDVSLVEEPLAFFGLTASIVSITDHAGRPVEWQVLETSDGTSHRMSRYAPPIAVRVRRVRLAIHGASVPSLGYAVLDVHVASAAAAHPPGAPPGAWSGANTIENDLVRVEANDDGTVDVVHKLTSARYRSLFALEDVGDVGDEYNYAPPRADRRVNNADARHVRVSAGNRGPLRASIRMDLTLPVPVAAAPDRSARLSDVTALSISLEICVRAASPVVECIAIVDNQARDHRLRISCPTGAAIVTEHRADTAFGVVRRPAARPVPRGSSREKPVAAAPMQSFVDAGDAVIGAVLVGDGLAEYEVCAAEDGAVIALTLLRAVGDLSRNDLTTRENHAGPGLPTPGAQCLGSHRFRLAFVPRAAPPSPGALYGAARAVLAPPRLVSPCGGDGHLPAAASFVRLDAAPEASVVLSACKVADARETVVLRVFNPNDHAARLTIAPLAGIRAAYLTDLLETREAPCATDCGHVQVSLGPHRIQTVELELEGK